MPNPASTDNLLSQIKQKRVVVSQYVTKAVPRKRRLQNVTIVAGSLSAALTAAPAIGGQSFTGWLTRTLGLDSPAWQILCGSAAVCSVTAAIATQLLKSHNLDEHLARAQSCRAKLEVLEIGLGTGQLEVGHTTTEYMRCVEETAFIESS